MALYFIGLGLGDEKDISVRGLETIKRCSSVYLEYYTSTLQCSVSELEKFYAKKIIIASRETVENNGDTIIDQAKTKDVAFLVVGDPFCATTHSDLYLRAKEKNVHVKVIHNASIISALGEIGLDVYKYGRITTIPFHNENISSPIDVLKQNQKNNLHTLFLFDVDPIKKKYMTIKDAIDYLVRNKVKEIMMAVGIAAIGTDKAEIKSGTLKQLKEYSFSSFPQCVVIPAKMHFIEEEMIKQQSL